MKSDLPGPRGGPHMRGWLHSLTEDQFGDELQEVLSPSRAIQSPEYLRGRAEQLEDIRKSWYSPGRQIFIHGYRGVGKSSLAQTAAFQRQSADSEPILLACTRSVSFFDLIRDMLEQGLPSDPRVVRQAITTSAGISAGGLSAEMQKMIERGKIPKPQSLNEAIRLTAFLARTHSEAPVIIIDEFDLLDNQEDQAAFAEFVKQIGDQRIPIRFIFCGIGESLDDLMAAHASAHRYFHSVKLDRLGWEPRFEITDNAASHLGIEVDDATQFRIAKISDGFPHYVHLICEKLFWLVYENRSDGRVTGDLFEMAMRKASDSLEPELKRPYEKATRKYTNDYEEILWAVADAHELQRASHQIYDSYIRIMKASGKEPLERKRFNARINNLKKAAYASILLGTRAGWYEYREKIIRGYARLRAEQQGVELEIEHPTQSRRFGSRIRR